MNLSLPCIYNCFFVSQGQEHTRIAILSRHLRWTKASKQRVQLRHNRRWLVCTVPKTRVCWLVTGEQLSSRGCSCLKLTALKARKGEEFSGITFHYFGKIPPSFPHYFITVFRRKGEETPLYYK